MTWEPIRVGSNPAWRSDDGDYEIVREAGAYRWTAFFTKGTPVELGNYDNWTEATVQCENHRAGQSTI